MVTVSHVVKNVLQRQVLIQEAINNKIVSYNKLAKYLKPKIEAELDKPVKNSAVIMAIKRNSDKLISSYIEPSSCPSVETIKTDIFKVVLEESPTLLNKLNALHPIINYKKGGMLNIIHGNYEVSIITNSKYKEKLLDLLYDESIICTIDNLVSISLTYPKDFLLIPGGLYDMSRSLAWDNINVSNIIVTKTEVILIMEKEGFIRCYNDPPWKPVES